MVERKVVDPARSARSTSRRTFPTTGYTVHAHNLDPELVKRSRSVLQLPWRVRPEGRVSKEQDRFVPITYKKDWSVIRKIDAATGVKYSCK